MSQRINSKEAYRIFFTHTYTPIIIIIIISSSSSSSSSSILLLASFSQPR